MKVLMKTKNTSPGEDGISYAHLKHLPEIALRFLAQLYQTSWECSYFPDLWKKGSTILLPKPGKDKADPKNYRPITLLSAVGKTMERVINVELCKIIDAGELIPESQAGFREGRSTHDQIFKIIQSVTNGFQKDEVTVSAMYDIEKSYDKIWHNGLLLKLRDILNEETVAFIHSYLTDRSIRIKIQDKYSEPITLRAGTAQGSILSPQIHNLWCHDIPQPTDKTSKLSQYADDLAIWTTGKSSKKAEKKLQLCNDRIVRWCKVWRIKLSLKKTQITVFHRKRIKTRPSIKVEGNKLVAGKKCEFLGVILDSKLQMKDHMEKIGKELGKRAKVLKKIAGSHLKPRADTDLCLKIFRSMIIPMSTYAPTTLCIGDNRRLQKIDIILRKAARTAIHAPPSTRNEYLTSEVGLKNAEENAIRLAKKYLQNPKRSRSVKKLIDQYRAGTTDHSVLTPLDKILK